MAIGLSAEGNGGGQVLCVAGAHRSGHRSSEEGFTLIELMIVVLILAVLLGTALATFLGSRTKAQDRAAQANLRTGLTTIKTAYVDSQSYVAAASQLASLEPSLTFVTAPGASSTSHGQIAVNAVDDQSVGMAVLASDGVCWQLFDAEGDAAGTTYGSVRATTSATCTAPGAPLAGTTW
jgi:prepilin-type N-terminal cleavage/methylation domain-containing protein